MKKLLLAFVMIIIINLSAGCTSHAKEMKISLKGNPTAGYGWTYTLSKEGIIKEDRNYYVQDEAPHDVVGRGGTYYYIFVGGKEGEVELTFLYARSWETVNPLYKVTYNLKVKKNKDIIYISSYGNYSEKKIPIPIIIK